LTQAFADVAERCYLQLTKRKALWIRDDHRTVRKPQFRKFNAEFKRRNFFLRVEGYFGKAHLDAAADYLRFSDLHFLSPLILDFGAVREQSVDSGSSVVLLSSFGGRAGGGP
jgi:hypothetical protein